MVRLLVLAALLISAPAWGQQRQLCAPRQALLEKFAQEFGEVPFSGGIDGAGNLMEILTSPKGTWTLLLVRPDKIACILGSGESWLIYEPTIAGRGA